MVRVVLLDTSVMKLSPNNSKNHEKTFLMFSKTRSGETSMEQIRGVRAVLLDTSVMK